MPIATVNPSTGELVVFRGANRQPTGAKIKKPPTRCDLSPCRLPSARKMMKAAEVMKAKKKLRPPMPRR